MYADVAFEIEDELPSSIQSLCDASLGVGDIMTIGIHLILRMKTKTNDLARQSMKLKHSVYHTAQVYLEWVESFVARQHQSSSGIDIQ